MKKLSLALILVALATVLSSGTDGGLGSAQDCEKSACRSGDSYNTSRQRCESGPNWLGYRSHYAASCPGGYDLDETRGVCFQPGECCTKRACISKFVFRRGRCTSRPSNRGEPSDYVPECGAGWDLEMNGFCRKRDCPSGGMLIERVAPETVVAGDTIEIHGRLFGRRQDSRVVSINLGRANPMTVVSWSPDLIVARVPAGLAAGRYLVLIYYDDTLATTSNSLEVTVRRR